MEMANISVTIMLLEYDFQFQCLLRRAFADDEASTGPVQILVHCAKHCQGQSDSSLYVLRAAAVLCYPSS